ncbi:MAG: hypothetical protein NTY12_01665 [Candidatus Falkowbacteria bacterium]|nr:hypothetical protein [Candidatus Falkowbacteria bacterium]
MEHSKLISSAAFLKLIRNDENDAVVGTVISAEGYPGKIFYNMCEGIEIINEYREQNLICEEEYDYLCFEIYNSGLTEEPIAEVNEGISVVRNHINDLESNYTRDYVIANARENFPKYPLELLNLLFEESIFKKDNSHKTIN